jgi:hypothetical protein
VSWPSSGVRCQRSLQALRPGTGGISWRDCLKDGPVIGAVTAVPGVVFAGEGPDFKAFDANTGATLEGRWWRVIV